LLKLFENSLNHMNVIEVNGMSKKFRLGAGSGDMRDRFKTLFSRDPEAQTARDFWALQDISFNVAEGESFGIIGHNGSGKSTLLKLLTGIYKPTSGTFKTQGRIAALIEVGAGFHQDLTGRENVYLNGSVLGMKKREIDSRYDEIVAFAELEKFMDTPVKRYSSGMYMRLGFAVAAHINPDIVLVDEVLAVGDEAFQAKCMKRMLELRAEGKTIVFISHSMGAVTQLCSRVLLLSRGQLIEMGEPRDVISTYRSMVAVEQSLKLDSKAAVRIAPTKEIKINDVRLINAEGKECDAINTGDDLTIECSYFADKRVNNPVFGMSLLREDGMHIYGFNTKYDSVSVNAIERGEGTYRVLFPTLGLLEGTYYFNVDISRPDDDIPGIFPLIDARDKAVSLTITDDISNIGLIELPHTWDFSGHTKQVTDADTLALSSR
jgi:ABC-type polysaccharide/polyol phosphate transport system ATPase subunit